MFRTLTSLALAASVAAASNATERLGESAGTPGVNSSYDYIVVGGGTGGLAIAARLAEEKDSTVAVIEAGGFYQQDNGNGSIIPGLCGQQGIDADPQKSLPLIDWNFTTTVQPGLGDRGIHYARGKTLGGSSALNFMLYHRGTKGSYDKWADEVGDDSYTFDALLPYFQRSVHITYPDNETLRENATVYQNHDSFNNDLPYHQPLHVSWAKFINSFSTWSKQAMEAVGINSSPSLDDGVLNGANYAPTTITPEKQHRDSSQTSFLDYAMRTTDIKVYANTMAQKILFDGHVAKSVLVSTSNQDYTLTANKEIILAAGAFQSPQLLMISGVGPKEALEAHEIPVVKELPGVGQNMMDHVYFGIAHRVDLPTASKLVYDPEYAAAAAESYRANGTGPLTAAVDLIAFERLVDNAPHLLPNATIDALRSKYPKDWPDVEYLTQDTWSAISNVNFESVDDDSNYAELIAAMLSPFARGNVTLSSADANDPPVINPNWLNDPRDRDVAIAAFKRLREIWTHMDDIIIGEEYKPGPEVQSDEEIWNWIQQDAITIWHASSTCKMGRKDDEMAVVDSRARVYGTERLRVVDASAFPFMTPGHPQSGIYMLAEKIAEDIKMHRT